MIFSPAELAVNSTLFAYSEQRREALKPRTRLAYYTTADTALKIIQSKTFWLRNPQLMNDYEEVLHGKRCLGEVLRDPEVVAAAANAIDPVLPGFFASLVTTWHEFSKSGVALPFVACLSEIDRDDDRGVLSMWRAYGGNSGVALVMRDSLLDFDSTFINTFHSPVLYGDVKELKEKLLELLSALGGIKSAVQAAGPAFLEKRLIDALQFAILSIKHPGFAEEKEWRMVHHASSETPSLKYKSLCVRGNAEVICEIDLASHAQLGPSAMIEKVIVGPCSFPDSTGQALGLAFHNAGGSTPKIVRSDIPLRHM